MKYLDEVVPVLKKLLSEFNFELVVISNKPPQFVLPNLRYIPWSEATEIDDLLQFNIGLMPLARDNWSEGKCGFKLIQYLSLGIPAVASAVGVNNQIIVEGINGYLCNKEDCWYQALKKLMLDASLRQSMGLRGHEKIVNQFSVRTNAEAFLKLFY
jgi:glycosyltransferase involved in cell wall biosynthesis